jgi:hypothetical protein
VDTDRDRDIALIEVQEENSLLIEEFMREKLGNRAKRMTDAAQEIKPAGAQPPIGAQPPGA